MKLNYSCYEHFDAVAEIADVKDRCLLVMACFLFWAVGYVTFWPLILFVENWHIIQTIIMVPTCTLAVFVT